MKEFEDVLTEVFISVTGGQDNQLSMRGKFAGLKQ